MFTGIINIIDFYILIIKIMNKRKIKIYFFFFIEIYRKRVDGELAVSRAFGDFSYKNRDDLAPAEQKVSCYPDIKIIERTPNDDILILACDGLWDVFSSELAVTATRELFEEGERDVSLIAEELLDLSLMRGSKDNISCIVVRLPGAQLGNNATAVVKNRRETRPERFWDNNNIVAVPDEN